MSKKLLLIIISAMVLAISGCQKEADKGGKAPADTASSGEAVVTINGEVIDQNIFNSYARARQKERPETDVERDRDAIIKELVNREMFVQEALKAGLDKLPAVAGELANQQKNILAAAMIGKVIRDNPITEEELKQEFDRFMAGASFKEYKLRHILTATEEDAKKAISRLGKGTNFSALAEKISKDSSAKNGGDLGWMNVRQMAKPFAAAVEALSKGKYTTTPVQTQFGWHVVMLDDLRENEPPKYEAVKNRLRGFVQKLRLESYINELRGKASIEIKPVAKAPADIIPAAPASTPAAAPEVTAPAAPATPAAPAAAPAEQAAPAKK